VWGPERGINIRYSYYIVSCYVVLSFFSSFCLADPRSCRHEAEVAGPHLQALHQDNGCGEGTGGGPPASRKYFNNQTVKYRYPTGLRSRSRPFFAGARAAPLGPAPAPTPAVPVS